MNSYALNRMALFPVTLSDPNYHKPPHFRHFCMIIACLSDSVRQNFRWNDNNEAVRSKVEIAFYFILMSHSCEEQSQKLKYMPRETCSDT